MNGPRIGEQRPVRMRRIGREHMVVLPPQSAMVVSARDLRRRLAQQRRGVELLEKQCAKAKALVADLEAQLARFDALPIERDDNDPDVPQPRAPASDELASDELASDELAGDDPAAADG